MKVEKEDSHCSSIDKALLKGALTEVLSKLLALNNLLPKESHDRDPENHKKDEERNRGKEKDERKNKVIEQGKHLVERVLMS